jgi:hypothetical protein
MKNANKYLTITLIMLVVVMLSTQLLSLALLGTKGNEISSIRREQDEYRQLISSTRADIDSVRTLAYIQTGMKVVFPAATTKQEPININLARTDGDTLGLIPDGN